MRGKYKSRFIVIALICCVLSVVTWLSSQRLHQLPPQDFEQCSERAERTVASGDERVSLIAQCDKEFIGRRKMGGGYTYYDFLQNRHFNIAGPNPTKDELKYFDQQYTLYLGAQRRDAVAAALAQKQRQIAQADSKDDHGRGSISSPGSPMVIVPTNVPIPRARNSVIRFSARCDDASFSCSWTKFSAGIKDFFESMAKGP